MTPSDPVCVRKTAYPATGVGPTHSAKSLRAEAAAAGNLAASTALTPCEICEGLEAAPRENEPAAEAGEEGEEEEEEDTRDEMSTPTTRCPLTTTSVIVAALAVVEGGVPEPVLMCV